MNGNIRTYWSNDNNSIPMYQLTYKWNQENRLMLMVDASASTAFADDVKGTESFEYDAIGNSAYDYATHYTYDVAGNVTTLIHDVPELEAETYQTVHSDGSVTTQTHRFKRLDYTFDLVSGKVNQLAFQSGQRIVCRSENS